MKPVEHVFAAAQPAPPQAPLLSHLRVAVVHDWLVSYAGAERVTTEILRLFPQAELFAVVDFRTPESLACMDNRPARTTFIQRLPGARTRYRGYLPLMPLAVEQLDLSNYDLVLSSSHAVAKGVITGPHQLHIAYVHSPMRYAWDLQHQYLRESKLEAGLKGWLARWLLHRVRLWDLRTANGVDHFIANSHFIRRRIEKVYRREAAVVHPPVDVDAFTFSPEKDDYFITASRLVPYKRVDLIVEAFARMPDKRLVVVGDGPDFARIRGRRAPNVTMCGYLPHAELMARMQRARAFVFAAEEDFGIVAVEAQACGTPVIAFGRGGNLETVRASGDQAASGVLFPEQSVDALCAAVQAFDAGPPIDPAACRAQAERFATPRFREAFARIVMQRWNEFAHDERAAPATPALRAAGRPSHARAASSSAVARH
jgi:glycosyltransferase involved in cell wall biosynthesis